MSKSKRGALSPGDMSRRQYFDSFVTKTLRGGFLSYFVPGRPREAMSWQKAWDHMGYVGSGSHLSAIKTAILMHGTKAITIQNWIEYEPQLKQFLASQPNVVRN
jgi:hypothetical protein